MANKILKLAALAGLGYAGFSALSSSEKTATTKALGFTAVPKNETDFVELIKNTIKGDKELQRLLTGPNGAIGATGATGATGASGDTIQNYGGSLIKNGAIENDVAWTGGTIDGLFSNSLNVMKTLNIANCSESCFVDVDSLYKVEYWVKIDGVSSFGGGIGFECYSKSNQNLGICYPNSWNSNTSNSWVKKISYFGGNGSLNFNFISSTLKIKPFLLNQSTCIYVSGLVVSKVNIAEPVPHNLPYLPINQTVLNSVTGKVGIFNGSTVDYYM